MIAAAAFVVATALPAADPRPALVELDLSRREAAALQRTSAALQQDPAGARALGLDFFRGHLLEKLGRSREATEALAQSLTAASPLAPWSRARLAEIQEQLGHPEVAAGLIATLLAHRAPETLQRRGIELLERSIRAGGDCRLLGGLPRERFAGAERRIRDLLDLYCEQRATRPPSVPSGLVAFLQAGTTDVPAWEAASLALDLAPTGDRTLDLLLALTAFHHRDFVRTIELLDQLEPLVPTSPLDALTAEAAYARARSAFWMGRYREAATRFDLLARRATEPERRSDADHQLGRSLELAGDLDAARAAFERSYLEDPRGDWAGASLLSSLRLALLRGDEAGARSRLTTLAGNPSFSALTARGALFIAVSSLVRGRSDGVAPLLALAERTREVSDEEVAYWRGRLAELADDAARAAASYLEASSERPFHPFALAALRRLRRPELASEGARLARRYEAEASVAGLWRASLLTQDVQERSRLERTGRARIARERDAGAWVRGGFLPVERWPVWSMEPSEAPEDLLAGLGLLAESDESVWRYFPSSDPATALTASAILAAGDAHRRSIAVAEGVFRRRPREVPLGWVAPDWLRLLYPAPWREAIVGQAAARGLDPALLAAVLREESRFDPAAVSPAAARGLSQLVLPTARRLAREAGIPPPQARDLHDPLLSILLGATYLGELSARFQGNPVAITAAYNAGEDQAVAWQRSCFTNEPEELLSKIGFGETRAYVARVLQSRATYLYLGLGALP